MAVERPVLLAAGGTGGHLFPAQALAAELARRGRRSAFITDRRAAGFGAALAHAEVHMVRSASPSGGALRAGVALITLFIGTVEARALLRRLKPLAVVGFGGYASVPAVVAASQLGIPTLVHEQNAVLGRANRLLARRADRLATSFGATAGLRLAPERIVHTGNPVRPAIAALAVLPYEPPVPGGALRLVVLGGSQGAQVFDRVVPEALARLPAAMRARLRVLQQCRGEDLPAAREGYAAAAITAELAPFIQDVAGALEDAHLVIARAGASTVAELAAAGRPAILVPYPFAADDHQNANAQALAAAGGAWRIAQDEFDPDSLAHELEMLLCDPDRLAGAATAARLSGRPHAAGVLADLIDRLVNGSAATMPAARGIAA